MTTDAINLWVDDELPAPPGFLWVKTARDALRVLRSRAVTYASLDCDRDDREESGVWLVLQMIVTRSWPEYKPGVHSANWPNGSLMLRLVREFGPYDENWSKNGFVRRYGYSKSR